jgi:PadR family transcriptional regulator PadR
MPPRYQTMSSSIARPAGCPCAGVSLDRLVQPRILAVLAGGSLHGYRIVEEIAGAAGLRGRPDVTGVYRSLRSMERRGLLTSCWEASRSGPARRLYRITGAGRTCLETWAGTLEAYRKEIVAVLRLARRPRRQAGARGR